jgi:type II secretory pathway pseudopilin PulG
MKPFQAKRGHSLLEALVAAGIFVMVSVALMGVWVMYGKALAKSGEVMAANSIARSVTEGLTSNGWDWLWGERAATLADRTQEIVVERRVRGRQADIFYNVTWELEFNTGGSLLGVDFSEEMCSILVRARWRSSNGSKTIAGTDYNNETTYRAFVYRHGI